MAILGLGKRDNFIFWISGNFRFRAESSPVFRVAVSGFDQSGNARFGQEGQGLGKRGNFRFRIEWQF